MRLLKAVPISLLIALAACGGGADPDGAAQDTSAVAGDSTTAPETTAATSTTVASTSTTSGSDGSFCDELGAFLVAWTSDEISPVDLTGEYLRLAEIAPSELVEPFQTLAEGNEEILASGGLSDQQAYDAAGAAVLMHAEEECGIELAA